MNSTAQFTDIIFKLSGGTLLISFGTIIVLIIVALFIKGYPVETHKTAKVTVLTVLWLIIISSPATMFAYQHHLAQKPFAENFTAVRKSSTLVIEQKDTKNQTLVKIVDETNDEYNVQYYKELYSIPKTK